MLGSLVSKNGLVWTVGTKSHTLITFDPKQGKIISSYPITTNSNKETDQSNQRFQMVWSIVEDNDGSIWIPQGGSDPLLKFDPHTEKFQVIHSISAAPMRMQVDQKTGNIWFTTFGRGTFGVIQKVVGNEAVVTSNSGFSHTNPNPGYKVTEFDLGNESFPSGIFLDKEGSVWITETLNQNKIVEFKPVVDATGIVVNVTKVLEIPQSSVTSKNNNKNNNNIIHFTTPTDLVVFEGNNNKPSSVWVAEHGTSFMTKYSFHSNAVVRFPTSSSPRHYTTLPYWISEPTNHKGFWFNEHYGNRIAFFNMTDSTLSEYEVPTRDPLNGYIANVLTLSADPNDNDKVWFTEFNHDKIGVLDISSPIPFDLDSPITSHNLTILSSPTNNKTQNNASSEVATTNVEVTRKVSFNNANDINHSSLVFLNASSSMNPLGRFVNMTAKFYPTSVINFTKMNDCIQKAEVQILLQRNDSNSIPAGNYTVGISSTDGKVTKSIFKQLRAER
jgi:hypothetical protein